MCLTEGLRMTCGRSVAGPMDQDAFSGTARGTCAVRNMRRLGGEACEGHAARAGPWILKEAIGSRRAVSRSPQRHRTM